MRSRVSAAWPVGLRRFASQAATAGWVTPRIWARRALLTPMALRSWRTERGTAVIITAILRIRGQTGENGGVKPVLPDILASRYASEPMVELWSPERKIRLERELWIAVMEAQRSLGGDSPAEAVHDYRAVVDAVDLDSIEARERVNRHDVKARLEEFSALAGHEHAHMGMTSAHLTRTSERS